MVVQIVPQSDPYASVGQAAGEGLSTGLQMLVNEKMAAMQAQKLLERGFTPQEAKLWQQFTEGGKTHLAREIVERLQREEGFTKRGLGTPEEGVSVEADLGLTPKEKIGRESERYKSNLPLFEKAHAKAQSTKLEQDSIQRLQHLNEAGKLPKGIQRWNINFKEGEIRIPFLANADTQAFIKTINDFTTKAKESFGARVTNFELRRFMKRLPSLLNSEEGRRVILRQMEIINELNLGRQQGILDAFDSRGGLRKLDYDQAQRIADKTLKPITEKLRKEYIELDSRKLTKEAEEKKPSKLKKTTTEGVLMRDTQGRLRRVKKEDVKAAKTANYTLE